MASLTDPTIPITLRETAESDFPTFYLAHIDPEANRMAGFTEGDPIDRDTYYAGWTKTMADPTKTTRTILYGGEIAGVVLSFPSGGKPEVGYWLGRQYWGKGIATSALRQFLTIVTTRPLYASAAADNIGSCRVLEKCGFIRTGTKKDFAEARQEEIDEAFYRLD